jgi:hypothetical protein
MPTLGSVDPMTEMARQIRDLQRQVQELAAAKTLENSTIGQGGINVTQGGSITTTATTGNATSIFGALPAQFNRLDGTPQQGSVLLREDGTIAVAVADLSPTTSPIRQAFQVQDRTPNIVFADDTNSGKGIAVPYLNFGPFQSNSAPTDTTTSATYATLQTAIGYWMNPRVFIQILVRSSDASTTGNVRVIDQANNVIGSPIAVAAAAFQYVNIGPIALPGNFKDSISLNIQAQRTAGTGTIGVRGIGAVGMQS